MRFLQVGSTNLDVKAKMIVPALAALLPMQPVKKVAMTDQHCCPCRSTNFHQVPSKQNKNKYTHPQLGLPAAHFLF